MSDTHSYYRLCFKLVSPMLIGGGKNNNTDNDVLLGKDGKPYIPATSIAGALRGMQEKDDDKKRLFGVVERVKDEKGNVKTVSIESPAILSDAVINGKAEATVTRRDNVALDEFKVAKESAKFNYEVVQPGVEFVAIAEINKDHSDITADFEKLLAYAAANGLSFGAKSTRGLGKVELSVGKKSFDFDDGNALGAWLEYDPFKASDFTPVELKTDVVPDTIRIKLELKQKGGLSIRYYTGEIGGEKQAAVKNSPLLVRAEPLEGEDCNGEYISDPGTPSACSLPVIPGTSWAGAFRRRFMEFAGEDLTKEVFGHVDNTKGKDAPKKAIKSKIAFSETVLRRGIPKKLTRIAIDRFSGAIKDKALLTEQSVFYGEGELLITIDRGVGQKALQALLAVISDLHNGFLAVGGETAIGRGMFEIKGMTINENAVGEITFCKMKTVLDKIPAWTTEEEDND